MSYDIHSGEVVKLRSDLNAVLEVLNTMYDDAMINLHPQARDLSIAITHIEDALMRINRAVHTP